MQEEDIIKRTVPQFNVWLTIKDKTGKKRRILGKGKAQLLRAVHETGSIKAASEEIPITKEKKITFRTAWKKIHRIEEQLNETMGTQNLKVIHSERGGSDRGGSTLTPLGEALLRRYDAIEELVSKTLETEQK